MLFRSTTTKSDSSQPAAESTSRLFDNWFDPLETEVRARARQFIAELLREELDSTLARPRYERSQMASNEARIGVAGHRHGSRTRSLTGTFGPIEIIAERNQDRGAAGPTDHVRGQDDGMEEPSAARLSTSHTGCRRADREHVSGRHQYVLAISASAASVRR